MTKKREEKTTEPQLLSDILYSFLDKTLHHSDHWFALKLWQCWSQLATTDLLKQSKPVSFQKGRLVLWVQHSVELMELSFQIETLKHNINRHFKKQWVQDIHFTVNTDILQKRQKSFHILEKIFPSTTIEGSK